MFHCGIIAQPSVANTSVIAIAVAMTLATRRAEIRFIVTMPPPISIERSAPVIMCFYWDRNAMVVTLFSLLDGTDYGPYNGHYYQNKSHYGADNSRQQLRIRREQRNHPIRRYVPENQRDHADNHA